MVRLSFSKRKKKITCFWEWYVEQRGRGKKQGTATDIHVRKGGSPSKGYMEVGQREEMDLRIIEIERMQLEAEQG